MQFREGIPRERMARWSAYNDTYDRHIQVLSEIVGTEQAIELVNKRLN